MTKKKIVREQAWWVDETVPDLSSALPDGIDVEAFSAWLGPVLGNYRDDIKARAAIPPIAEETAIIRDMIRKIDAVTLALHAAAPLTDATLATLPSATGEPWLELRQRLIADMCDARFRLIQAEAALSRLTPKRGRKSTAPRDVLLAEVVAKLRAVPMKANDARAAAARIVGLCGAETLVDADSIKGADRRGQQKP